jgi:phospho-N-acetylmuramoyl-pentapeptide-transferase
MNLIMPNCWLDRRRLSKWAWLVFIPVVIFIITAVSNGANLTDGIDGLAAGTSAISVLAWVFFTFVSGNIIFQII